MYPRQGQRGWETEPGTAHCEGHLRLPWRLGVLTALRETLLPGSHLAEDVARGVDGRVHVGFGVGAGDEACLELGGGEVVAASEHAVEEGLELLDIALSCLLEAVDRLLTLATTHIGIRRQQAVESLRQRADIAEVEPLEETLGDLDSDLEAAFESATSAAAAPRRISSSGLPMDGPPKDDDAEEDLVVELLD